MLMVVSDMTRNVCTPRYLHPKEINDTLDILSIVFFILPNTLPINQEKKVAGSMRRHIYAHAV